jgi:hypothetical protein
MPGDSRDVVTVQFDLATRTLLGVLTVAGKSVYKPCVYGSQFVAYAVKAGSGMDDRYIGWSNEFSIEPLAGVRSPVVIADNGSNVQLGGTAFRTKDASLEQRCHWKLGSRWFCTKMQRETSEEICLSCQFYDSSAPVRKEMAEVSLAHKVAAVTLDKLTDKSVKNQVDRSGPPPSTISIIENPFFESETCKSGLFCTACREDGQAGVAFRTQVGFRWGLPNDFPCPYVLEGCAYRGAVLSIEEKTCCGGKVKVLKTYECSAQQNDGKVTIDHCLLCPIRNRRRLDQSREAGKSLQESPWADPSRRLSQR